MPHNSNSKIEWYIYKLVNSSRKRHHLGKMRWNKGLSSGARHHSKRMARAKNIFHDPAAGFENVAYVYHPGLSDWELAKTFHRQWMRSSGHRANILHPSNNSIGIGVARRGDHFFATQKFTFQAWHPQIWHHARKYENNLGEAIVYLLIIIFIIWVILSFFRLI